MATEETNTDLSVDELVKDLLSQMKEKQVYHISRGNCACIVEDGSILVASAEKKNNKVMVQGISLAERIKGVFFRMMDPVEKDLSTFSQKDIEFIVFRLKQCRVNALT